MRTDKMFELFDKTKGKLLYPKILIPTELNSTKRIKFNIASSRASRPGLMYISNGESWPNSVVYGVSDKKMSDVEWYKGTPHEIKKEIEAILEDPIGRAKVQGQKYSFCCFCGLMLTNTNSLAAGYGPICADNFGLPWEGLGEAAKEKEILDDL